MTYKKNLIHPVNIGVHDTNKCPTMEDFVSQKDSYRCFTKLDQLLDRKLTIQAHHTDKICKGILLCLEMLITFGGTEKHWN